jgi:hypothetical protein
MLPGVQRLSGDDLPDSSGMAPLVVVRQIEQPVSLTWWQETDDAA